MEWYHVWWPWLTSKRVARFVSDSWVSCSYRPGSLPVAQPTASKHNRQKCTRILNNLCAISRWKAAGTKTLVNGHLMQVRSDGCVVLNWKKRAKKFRGPENCLDWNQLVWLSRVGHDERKDDTDRLKQLGRSPGLKLWGGQQAEPIKGSNFKHDRPPPLPLPWKTHRICINHGNTFWQK